MAHLTFVLHEHKQINSIMYYNLHGLKKKKIFVSKIRCKMFPFDSKTLNAFEILKYYEAQSKSPHYPSSLCER